jgi:hemoglobin
MDITTRADIEQLVNTFYGRVRQDDLIGPIFNEIVGDHWDTHLPKMYNFWAMSLLGEGGYRGNAVQQHVQIDQQHPLEAEHFNRWIGMWEETVDSLYTGALATDAKKKAGLMLQLIRIKIAAGRTGKSLF